MSDSIQILVGKRLEAIALLHDYMQLSFYDRCGLSVFNQTTFSRNTLDGLYAVLDQTVAAVDTSAGAHVTLWFDNDAFIRIGMSPDDFHNKEAMLFTRSDGTATVWNPIS